MGKGQQTEYICSKPPEGGVMHCGALKGLGVDSFWWEFIAIQGGGGGGKPKGKLQGRGLRGGGATAMGWGPARVGDQLSGTRRVRKNVDSKFF